jgi:hypothetical protein
VTELTVSTYEQPSADLGPENPLPVFRDPQVSHPRDPDMPIGDDLPNLGWQTGGRWLPHRTQDGYNRVLQPRSFAAAVLENEFLRATFLPELGGRLASLVHKQAGREILYRNPVFQPAALALRNAWFSGGIEWNTCQPGHYYLTCGPVHMARVKGNAGEPVLRIYEWDRVKCFPWQIDFHLPPGSKQLFARMRLVNPHDNEIPMYWWTNIAVPEAPDIRVLAPANDCYTYVIGGKWGVSSLPVVTGLDVSYSTNVRRAWEFFFRISAGHPRWVAALDRQGTGLFQTSTARLAGRKLFCWGMAQGGRHWQDFLSHSGQPYIEIQAGLASTQAECLPMPARAEWAWTEAFGLLAADPAKVHGSDWPQAWQAAEASIERQLPADRLNALHADYAAVAARPPAEILFTGSGWGALERGRLAAMKQPDRIPAELVFDPQEMNEEQAPWLSLLATGVLPESDPQADPRQGMVQPDWRTLLEKSVQTPRGENWLAWLHLGNMRFEAFENGPARQAWERSIAIKPSSWAYRNLAVLEKREGRMEQSCEYMAQAWQTGPRGAKLAIEYADLLAHFKRFDELHAFCQSAPPAIRSDERMRIYSAQAAMTRGDLAEVEALFTYPFATIHEGEIILTDMWFELHERRIAEGEGIPRDKALHDRVVKECPPPANIDFRMGAEISQSAEL